ncbi:MAG: OmpA family protein, partial [Candidatus Cloacimonadota bacterium]|nr:OmpA family protein [Candidatus Cloacimonadota bacterium]
KRAEAVADYLINQEVSEERIETAGYGFEQPIADNNNSEGRQLNRRVEMKIIGIAEDNVESKNLELQKQVEDSSPKKIDEDVVESDNLEQENQIKKSSPKENEEDEIEEATDSSDE